MAVGDPFWEASLPKTLTPVPGHVLSHLIFGGNANGHIATVKLLRVGNDNEELELLGEGESELELYGDGVLQIIEIPEERSFFISPDEVRKLIAGLQKGLSKIVPKSGTC